MRTSPEAVATAFPAAADISEALLDRETVYAVTKRHAHHFAFAGPPLREQIVSRANDAMAGMLILPGTRAKPRFVGNPPDWFANPVGDREYTWTLNRCEHWPALLRAWRLTGRQQYSNRVMLELRDWLTRCTCPAIDPSKVGQRFHDGSRIGAIRTVGKVLRQWPAVYRTTQKVRTFIRKPAKKIITPTQQPLGETPYNTLPWRTLEAGVRMVHVWPMLKRHLQEQESVDLSLFDHLERSAQQHGVVLATLSPLLWPAADHNHYLMETLGLLTTAVAFPDLPEATAWKIQAMAEIERCARAQFTEEGGHIEGCPHYHNVCVYLLARAVFVARQASLTFSDRTLLTLERSLQHCLHTLRPDGVSVPAGDSDADQLAVQATLFGYLATGDIVPLRRATALAGIEALRAACVEHFDCIEDVDLLLARCQQPAADQLPLISWQRQLKQATLRTGWDGQAISLFFTCRTPVHNGHAHADPAAFEMTALGQPMLLDPGRLTYVDNAERKAIKSAAWHNTVTVDHREPFEYLSSMQFGPQQHGDITGVIEQPGLKAAESCHCNFNPVIHRRLLAIVRDRYVLVLDSFEKLRPRSRVQLHWHLNSTAVSWSADQSSVHANMANAAVSIFTTAGVTGTAMPVNHAPTVGMLKPSISVQFEDEPGRSCRFYGALIVPRLIQEKSPSIGRFVLDRQEDAVGCSLEFDQERLSLLWHPAAQGRPLAVDLK